MACPPSNVVGPYSQTKFLGASIVRYTSRVGWNGDVGTLEVTVAEDTCAGTTKIYYDACGSAQTTTEVDAFNPPTLGTPVYFRFGDFEFGGILKSWERDKTTSGKFFYITVTDPMEILQGTQVILRNYTGETFGVPNLLNAYGYLENSVPNCSTVTTGMNPALGYTAPVGFGNVNENDAGVQWNQLRSGLITMINSIPIVSSSYGSRLQLRSNNFFVDLTEVPSLDSFFRISGDSATLAEIIDQVCKTAGMDYFSELVYVTGLPGMPACSTDSDTDGHLDGAGVAAFIKLRTVSGWSAAPTALSGYIVDSGVDTAIDVRVANGTIGDFVTDVENDDVSGAKQHRSGIELRQAVTNAFVVGDSRQDVWQIEQTDPLEEDGTDNIWPWWGLDDDNVPLVGTGVGLDHTVTIPQDVLTSWNIAANMTDLGAEAGVNGLEVKVSQILAAQDSFASWLSYINVFEKAIFDSLGAFADIAGNNLGVGDFLGAAIDGDGAAKPFDLIDATRNFGANVTNWAKNNRDGAKSNVDAMRSWYEHIRSLGEYFGKKFLVKMPFTCAANDPNQPFTLKLNWLKNDAAWTDADVLGFANASPGLEFFRAEDGRIQCFVRFDADTDEVDFASLSEDDVWIIDKNEVYVRATVEQIVYMDPVNFADPRAVLSIGNPVTTFSDLPAVPLHAALLVTLLVEKGHVEADAVNNAQKFLEHFSVDIAHYGMMPLPILPVSAAVPLRSATLSYGPWISTLAAGPASETSYSRDTAMSPWSFGSTVMMNGAGAISVESQVTNIVAVETGSISVPGSPVTSLGRLLRVGGPTITSIDTSVSKDEVSTTYRMRTWTPNFGDIGRRRIEALRTIGQNQQKIQRAFIRNFAGRDNMGRNVNAVKAWRRELTRPDAFSRQTSAGWIGAETMADHRDDTMRRDFGAVTDIKKALPTLMAGSGEAYQTKAGCEFIGVFRGFSTSKADTNWADYDTPGNDTSVPDDSNGYFYSSYQVPPVAGEDHMPITCNTLNPFLDPNDSWLSNMHEGSDGHDIDYVIRDGVYPTNLNIQDDDYSSSQSYRAIGLRAPLVLVGWGFDTHNKPVPNASMTNDQMKFADDWLRKPHTWKAGPLDVRWDHDRKVWTAPTAFKIVKARLLDHLPACGSTSGILMNETRQVDDSGVSVETAAACGADDQFIYDINDHGMYPKLKGTEVMLAFNNGTYDVITDRPYMFYGITDNCVEPGSTGVGVISEYFVGCGGGGCDSPTLNIINKLNQPLDSGQGFFGVITDVQQTGVGGGTADAWVLQANFSSICVVTQIDCLDVDGDGEEEIVSCDRNIYLQSPAGQIDCAEADINLVANYGAGSCVDSGVCD